MKELVDYMDIPPLIVKSLEGNMTEEERVRLREWLAENPLNKELYANIKERRSRDRRESIGNLWNIALARRKITQATVTPVRRVHFLMKIAAVLIPLFIISASYYLFWNRDSSSWAMQQMIKPGEVRAKLTLAGGEVILLDEDQLRKHIATGIVADEGKGIVYQSLGEERDTAFNYLQIPRGGEFKVTLSDGTVVFMNSESELGYPCHFSGDSRRVSLSGEAYFEVTEDANVPFIVDMDKITIKVLGTSFNARIYDDEGIVATTLVSGSVRISSDDESLTLLPGEQGVLDKSGRLTKKEVDAHLYTAWKDGDFVFRKQRLEEIMNIVTRWYNVEVRFMDEESKDVSFSGSIRRYDGFDKLMRMLELTESANFRTEDGVIIISKEKR